MIYDKAIRDEIPEILTKEGKKFKVEKVSDEIFLQYLNKKLLEEVNKYLESNSIEELADISEVITYILKLRNVNINQFESIALTKIMKKGTFEENLILKEIE